MSKQYKGRIEEWTAGDVLVGRLYNDPTKRWPNGSLIRTSFVLSVGFGEGDKVLTLNSQYLLGKPFSPHKHKDIK